MTQFLRDQASDSEEVVTPLMLDGTYLSRNFATLGPMIRQPPCDLNKDKVLRQFLPNGLLFLSVLPQSYYVSIHLSFLVIIGLVHRRLVVDLYEEYNYIGAAVKGFWKQL